MEKPLDLSIILTSPPPGSHSDILASIALYCEPLGLSHKGDMLTAPITEREVEDLRWYLEEYWKWPYEQFRERGEEVEGLLPVLGKRLYKAVFGSQAAMGLLQSWRLQSESHRQISIVSALPGVQSLPWELLHDEQGFLALRTRNPVSIIRRLPSSELLSLRTTFELPLRILLVTARPENAGFLDPRSIARELLEEMSEQVEEGKIALEFLRPPTLVALRNRLRDASRPVHILHFDGHGTFAGKAERLERGMTSSEEGKLAFEDERGYLNVVEARTLAQVLQDSGVKLVVLDACQSAVSSQDEVFSSVAARLIQGGIDAVIAMSAGVLVAAATRYVESFYRDLAAGIPVATAQERARQALHDNPQRHLTRRYRDEEGQPVTLSDWWLPHYYQQHSLVFEPETALMATHRRKKYDEDEPLPVFNEEMPAEPRYGFSGRALEIRQIERAFLGKQLIVIAGFGGMGKTALAREAADWFTRTGLFERACFVSFEHGGDATLLLSTLGNFLGVYDGHYDPNNAKVALARIRSAVKKQRTLLIVDNLDSILPIGEAPLEMGDRVKLWDVLLELHKAGIGVILTSRDTNIGDGQLFPGKQVMHLTLQGLFPEDAYQLATRLLTDLSIDRIRTPYAELRDLLAQLDYHPLAIQLVLPMLRYHSLATIRADFARLLPAFANDDTSGRSRSLLASLDYSLRRLNSAQRAFLPRLAIFEGGASEDDLIAITEIPKDVWAKLRPALEQAALLTAEQVHEEISIPFLNFHPVLVPYLRSQPEADDVALANMRQRYARRYYAVAAYLYEQDYQHPLSVRALVRRELPNLRRALNVLLQEGEIDAASAMADTIAKFLTAFGMLREHELLRQQVANITAVDMLGHELLTRADYIRELGMAEDEQNKGNLQAAVARLTTLLARIEAQPKGTPLGRGTFEHSRTLLELALCFSDGGQPSAAEKRLREALSIIEALIRQHSENQACIRLRAGLLSELGSVLRDQGQYSYAKERYQEALAIYDSVKDMRNQAAVLGELGALALAQRDYAEAQELNIEALDRFYALGEPAMAASAWHQLGRVAQEQGIWAEAERCYRESLVLREQLADMLGAARTCNQLAIIVENAGRPTEAEGWYNRALELHERVEPNSMSRARTLSNLAALLTTEVSAGHVPVTRLAEALRYAEQALNIEERLEISTDVWNTFGILAQIADLEGEKEAAQGYRRRERESFAAYEGNRYHIDRQYGALVTAIVAARADAQARAAIEEILPQLEERGWHVSEAIKRIWVGERDWYSLVEDVDRGSALLVLRVLETLEQSSDTSVADLLPASIREALERGDENAIRQAFGGLSPEDQQMVVEVLMKLQDQGQVMMNSSLLDTISGEVGSNHVS